MATIPAMNGAGAGKLNKVISISGATDNVVIAAQGAGRAIRIHQLSLVASGGANTFTLKSGSSAITGANDLAADGQYQTGDSPDGLYTTGYDEAFVITLVNATLVTGSLKYSIIDANLVAMGMQK